MRLTVGCQRAPSAGVPARVALSFGIYRPLPQRSCRLCDGVVLHVSVRVFQKDVAASVFVDEGSQGWNSFVLPVCLF